MQFELLAGRSMLENVRLMVLSTSPVISLEPEISKLMQLMPASLSNEPG